MRPLTLQDVWNRVEWEGGGTGRDWMAAARRLSDRPCIGHKRRARLCALVTGIVDGLDLSTAELATFHRHSEYDRSEYTNEIAEVVRADVRAQLQAAHA